MMSQPEVEPYAAEAEYAGYFMAHHEVSQHEAAIYDLPNQKMDTMLAQERQELSWRFQDLAAIQATPEMSAKVMTIADEVDFGFFALPGNPLPKSYITVVASDGSRRVAPHPERMITGAVFDEVVSTVDADGVSTRIVEALNESKDEIIEKLKDFVQNLPEYQFLASFAEANPLTDADQPLNAFWRQVFESRIESDVRTQYGIPAAASLSHNYSAKQQYDRRIRKLDDESMPTDNVEQEQNAFSRLHQFFKDACQLGIDECRQWERDNPDEAGEKTVYPEGLWQFSYDIRSDEVDIIMPDGSTLFPSEIMDAQKLAGTERSHFGYPVSRKWLYTHALNLIHNPTQKFITYANYLDVLVSKCAEDLFNDERTIVNALTGHLEVSRTKLNELMPSGPMISERQYREWRRAVQPSYYRRSAENAETLTVPQVAKGASLNSQEQMESEHARSRGYVWQYPDQDPQPMRVMSSVTEISYKDLPRINRVDPYHLVIEFNLSRPGSAMSVPGYEIIGRNDVGDVIYAPGDHDPYDVPHIPIDADRAAELSKYYQEAGLTNLADAIYSQQDKLSATMLANLIRNTSKYYVPKQDDGFARNLDIYAIADFAGWVRDGKLHAQCDGANVLLQLSLQHLFGDHSVAPHNGNVIYADEKRISGMAHAQTAFIYEGKKYILDATPYGGPDVMARLGSISVNRSSERSLWRSPEARQLIEEPTSSVNKLPEGIDFISGEELKEENEVSSRNQILGQLEARLQIILDVKNVDQLYASVVTLPEHDPLRRTIKLARQIAAGDKVKDAELRAHNKYLDGIIAADLALKRRHGLEKYDDSLLKMLQSTTQSLRVVS